MGELPIVAVKPVAAIIGTLSTVPGPVPVCAIAPVETNAKLKQNHVEEYLLMVPNFSP